MILSCPVEMGDYTASYGKHANHDTERQKRFERDRHLARVLSPALSTESERRYALDGMNMMDTSSSLTVLFVNLHAYAISDVRARAEASTW